MLNIQNYTKRFGDKIAVDDLSLHIAAGEICAFIGHNGAGKTTTLKACCGLLKPDGGTITVNGIDIQKDPIACKKIMAYIPDNPDLYEFLTGYEYLNFVADMYGVSEADRKARMEALAERLDIKNALPNLISECSHGMKQKIAVIGALIHEPKLILMDEPFVGLDPIAAHELKEIMAEHCRNGGAIFFSTHVLEVAEKLCDNVAIIKNGKLIAHGTMDSVRGDGSLERVFLEPRTERGRLHVKIPLEAAMEAVCGAHEKRQRQKDLRRMAGFSDAVHCGVYGNFDVCGVRSTCSAVRNGAYMAVFRHGGHNGAGAFHAGQRFYDAGAVV